jgi:hypothetical protein
LFRVRKRLPAQSKGALHRFNYRGGFGPFYLTGGFMIVNNMGVVFHGEEDLSLRGSITQNNVPVLEQNYVEKMNTNNGFTEKRLFRKIASIPITAVLKAAQDGYNLDDRTDLDRFLERNKDYMSVEKMVSQRSPNIIIK